MAEFAVSDAPYYDADADSDSDATENVQPLWTPDQPNPDVVKAPRRKPGEAAYQKQMQEVIRVAATYTATNPHTIADSAALFMHGDELATSLGTLAAHDERIGKMVDWMSEGTENPYLAAAMATAPLVAQLIRNHEPLLEPKERGLKIPFTKRRIKLPFKFGIRVGLMRNVSNDPATLVNHVFVSGEQSEDVRAMLSKQGVDVLNVLGIKTK